MCILLYVKLIWCSGDSMDVWSIGGGGDQSLCGVVVFHRSMVHWRKEASALGICAFCYM